MSVVEFKNKRVVDANVTVIDLPPCCLTCDNTVGKGGINSVYCGELRQTMKPFNICDHFTLK